MAAVSKDISARLRLTDRDDKTVMTVSGIDTEVTPDDLTTFTLAVSALKNEPIGAIYLIVESELSEEATPV